MVNREWLHGGYYLTAKQTAGTLFPADPGATDGIDGEFERIFRIDARGDDGSEGAHEIAWYWGRASRSVTS